MVTDKKREWAKLVSDPKYGPRILLQGSQEVEAISFNKLLDEQIVREQAYLKSKAIFDNLKDNYFFKLRQEFEKVMGFEAWEKGIGFDNNAKKDGVMVINITEPQR